MDMTNDIIQTIDRLRAVADLCERAMGSVRDLAHELDNMAGARGCSDSIRRCRQHLAVIGSALGMSGMVEPEKGALEMTGLVRVPEPNCVPQPFASRQPDLIARMEATAGQQAPPAMAPQAPAGSGGPHVTLPDDVIADLADAMPPTFSEGDRVRPERDARRFAAGELSPDTILASPEKADLNAAIREAKAAREAGCTCPLPSGPFKADCPYHAALPEDDPPDDVVVRLTRPQAAAHALSFKGDGEAYVKGAAQIKEAIAKTPETAGSGEAAQKADAREAYRQRSEDTARRRQAVRKRQAARKRTGSAAWNPDATGYCTENLDHRCARHCPHGTEAVPGGESDCSGDVGPKCKDHCP